MDVQAKDRLTGAVILVVLLVLVVPELLSGPGSKPAAPAVHPSDEPPLRSYTVELSDEARGRHAVVSPATATPPAATAAPREAAAPPVDAAPPLVTAPAVATAPAAGMKPAAVTPAAATPQHLEPAKAAVGSHAPPESQAQQDGGAWTVQLGSFASRANAERLVRELKEKGFAAFWSESAGGGRKLYRVRVGPAANHATAEALRAKLHAAGHTGSLTQHP